MQLRIGLVCGMTWLIAGCGTDSDPDSQPGGLSNSTKPEKRSDIHGAIDPRTGVFAVFGGDDGPIINQRPQASYRSDTWVFEPMVGWAQFSEGGPNARGRHAVAYDSGQNRMLIFGGRFRESGTMGDYTLYNDLWAFDLTTKSWERLSDGSGGPAPRHFAVGGYDAASESFYVYGGDVSPAALAISISTELWRFQDNVWTQIPTSGASPEPVRHFMGYLHDTKRNALIAYGGQVGDFVTPGNRDLYSLDLATGAWSQLDDGTAETGPLGRFSSLMTYDGDNDRYLMMGGHADPGVSNDIWSYDPNARRWDELYRGDTFTGAPLGCSGNPRELPTAYIMQDSAGPQGRSGGFLGYSAGTLWLFGGESDCSDHLDDTWAFDLDSSTWEEVLAASSGESCLRQNIDCSCLCL